jgi:hypothetical protein
MEPYTAIPNWLLDDVLPVISPASTKVLMLIMRRTAGWQRESDAISVRQFSAALNLSRPTVLKALKELIACKVIAVDYGSTHGDRDVNVYSVLGGQDFLPPSQFNLPPSKESLPRGQEILPEGGKESLPQVVKKFDPYIKKGNKEENKDTTTRHAVAVEPADDVQSSPAKKTEHRKAEQRDERLDSWQVIAYRELARLSPPHAIRDRMVSEITDEPRWRDSVREWIGKGWSPRNISGMIDFYNGKKKETRHEEPQRDADGKSDLQRRMEAYLEENKKWLDPEYGAAQRSGPPPPPPHRSRQDWRD